MSSGRHGERQRHGRAGGRRRQHERRRRSTSTTSTRANSANDGVNLDGLGAGTFTANSSSTIGGAAGIAFDLNGGSGDVTFAGAINNGAGATAEVTGAVGRRRHLQRRDQRHQRRRRRRQRRQQHRRRDDVQRRLEGPQHRRVGRRRVHQQRRPHAELHRRRPRRRRHDRPGHHRHHQRHADRHGHRQLEHDDDRPGAQHGRRPTSARAASTSSRSPPTARSTASTSTPRARAGGLTVTGNGGTCDSAVNCTGGAIQSSTGAGIDLTSVGGGVSLTRMSVNGGGDDGIRGATVNGLSLANSRVVSNGNAVGENGRRPHAAHRQRGHGEHDGRPARPRATCVIANTSGTLSAFNVTGSTFSLDERGHRRRRLQRPEQRHRRDDHEHHRQHVHRQQGRSLPGRRRTRAPRGTIGVTFTGNTLTTTAGADPDVIGGGITLAPSGGADMTFNVSNNNVQQAFDEAINLNLGTASTGAASMIGTINGNTVGTAGDVDSGSESGTGISVVSNGAGRHDGGRDEQPGVPVRQPVRDPPQPQGGQLEHEPDRHRQHGGEPRARSRSTASAWTPAPRRAAGRQRDDVRRGCPATTSSTRSRPRIADIRLRQRFNTTIRLPGYGGANTDTAAVNTFVAGNNGGAEVTSAQNVGRWRRRLRRRRGVRDAVTREEQACRSRSWARSRS